MQERQRLQRCLQHALNNLLQRSAFTCADLDELANQLDPGRTLQPLFHPHRTWWLGNWDVNVLEVALRRHGKELQVVQQASAAPAVMHVPCLLCSAPPRGMPVRRSPALLPCSCGLSSMLRIHACLPCSGTTYETPPLHSCTWNGASASSSTSG